MKVRFNFGVSLIAIVIAALMASVAFCQETGGKRAYDPSTEMTVKGTVEEVKAATLPGGGLSEQARGNFGGPIHLQLKSDAGTYAVHLGPSWFLKSKGIEFQKGDQIEVTGSKFKDQNAIIAREVKKGDQVLTLRNNQGVPAWSKAPAPQ